MTMIYRFDEFELDIGLFELRSAGKVCELTQKCFDLLHYMLRRAGSVVTKEELYTSCWNEHVCPSTLPVHVRTIRKALGGRAALIRTVRGIGYQIACPVEVVDGPTHDGVPDARPKRRPRAKGDPLDVARLNGLLYLGLLLAEPCMGGQVLQFLALES